MGDRSRIYSKRTAPRVEAIFAVVVSVDGMEGIVRRDTPSGTQPWMTDDSALAPKILELAREASGYTDAYLARFERVG